MGDAVDGSTVRSPLGGALGASGQAVGRAYRHKSGTAADFVILTYSRARKSRPVERG
jgi:hypothetical protein